MKQVESRSPNVSATGRRAVVSFVERSFEEHNDRDE
jgi:hypothetical protein